MIRWPRLSTRWLMTLVAVLALLLGLWVRRDRYLGLAEEHDRQAWFRVRQVTRLGDPPGFDRPLRSRTPGQYATNQDGERHFRAAKEYERQAVRLDGLMVAVGLGSVILAGVSAFRGRRRAPVTPEPTPPSEPLGS